MMNRTLLALGALALLVACTGGSGGPGAPVAPATGFEYRDPQGSGWRLVRNAQASTPAHLVLDLVPPTGGAGSGVTLDLTVDGDAGAWSRSVTPGSAYHLGSGVPAAFSTVRGGKLSAAIAQKGATLPAQYDGHPVLSVALDFAGQAYPAGNPVGLRAARARHLEDPYAAAVPVTVAVGDLTSR
jgi:hypothetical protein